MMAISELTAKQERAWREWIVLRDKALETGDVVDGIASGKAFARFHYLFVEDTIRPASKIKPLQRLSDLGGVA